MGRYQIRITPGAWTAIIKGLEEVGPAAEVLTLSERLMRESEWMEPYDDGFGDVKTYIYRAEAEAPHRLVHYTVGPRESR